MWPSDSTGYLSFVTVLGSSSKAESASCSLGMFISAISDESNSKADDSIPIGSAVTDDPVK